MPGGDLNSLSSIDGLRTGICSQAAGIKKGLWGMPAGVFTIVLYVKNGPVAFWIHFTQ